MARSGNAVGCVAASLLALVAFSPRGCDGAVRELGGLRFAERFPSSATSACNGGFCSSVIQYPVRGTSYYAEFNVPKLPEIVGPTFFVYYNM